MDGSRAGTAGGGGHDRERRSLLIRSIDMGIVYEAEQDMTSWGRVGWGKGAEMDVREVVH